MSNATDKQGSPMEYGQHDTCNHVCSDIMHVPSHKVVGSCLNSMHAAGTDEWVEQDGMVIYIEDHSNSKNYPGITYVSFHHGEDGQGIDPLYCYLQCRNSIVADVFIICLCKWFQVAKKPCDKVIISVDEILDLRGIQPKRKNRYRAGHRNKDRIQVGRCIEALDRMYVESSSVIVYSPEGKKNGYLRETKIMLVHEKITEIRGSDGKVPLRYTISFETLGNSVLMASESRQTAAFFRKTLQYNPYTECWEKRVGFYLAFQWRYRMYGGNYLQPFKIGTLLAGIKETADRRYPERTRTRLEKALSRLTADSIIRSWRYANPDNVKQLPAKNWVQLWLNENIVIEAPDIILAWYRKREDMLCADSVVTS